MSHDEKHTTGGEAGPEGGGTPVGSVGEEAAKLLAALKDWAREGGGPSAAPADAAGRAADTATDATAAAASQAKAGFAAFNEHIATGGQDCTYCPVCQAIAVVRRTSPEVRHHLASAATSLMEAVAGALATEVPPERTQRRDTPVQKIKLDDETWDDEGEDD